MVNEGMAGDAVRGGRPRARKANLEYIWTHPCRLETQLGVSRSETPVHAWLAAAQFRSPVAGLASMERELRILAQKLRPERVHDPHRHPSFVTGTLSGREDVVCQTHFDNYHSFAMVVLASNGTKTVNAIRVLSSPVYR